MDLLKNLDNMWILLRKDTYPTEKGHYKCLIDYDGLGNLSESNNEYFNGDDWCHFESSRQFIRYWWKENIK